jgi:hypothetical protein
MLIPWVSRQKLANVYKLAGGPRRPVVLLKMPEHGRERYLLDSSRMLSESLSAFVRIVQTDVQPAPVVRKYSIGVGVSS